MGERCLAAASYSTTERLHKLSGRYEVPESKKVSFEFIVYLYYYPWYLVFTHATHKHAFTLNKRTHHTNLWLYCFLDISQMLKCKSDMQPLILEVERARLFLLIFLEMLRMLSAVLILYVYIINTTINVLFNLSVFVSGLIWPWKLNLQKPCTLYFMLNKIAWL